MPRKAVQPDVTLRQLDERIWRHTKERDWDNNPPRGLAVSILLEAAELLEHYQWSDKPVGDKDALAAEIADIFIYAFQFARRENIDIAEAIERKLQKAAQKYPAELFKGKTSAEMREAWLGSKLGYHKEGL